MRDPKDPNVIRLDAARKRYAQERRQAEKLQTTKPGVARTGAPKAGSLNAGSAKGQAGPLSGGRPISGRPPGYPPARGSGPERAINWKRLPRFAVAAALLLLLTFGVQVLIGLIGRIGH